LNAEVAEAVEVVEVERLGTAGATTMEVTTFGTHLI
jgi:hypothetical protein